MRLFPAFLITVFLTILWWHPLTGIATEENKDIKNDKILIEQTSAILNSVNSKLDSKKNYGCKENESLNPFFFVKDDDCKLTLVHKNLLKEFTNELKMEPNKYRSPLLLRTGVSVYFLDRKNQLIEITEGADVIQERIEELEALDSKKAYVLNMGNDICGIISSNKGIVYGEDVIKEYAKTLDGIKRGTLPVSALKKLKKPNDFVYLTNPYSTEGNGKGMRYFTGMMSNRIDEVRARPCKLVAHGIEHQKVSIGGLFDILVEGLLHARWTGPLNDMEKKKDGQFSKLSGLDSSNSAGAHGPYYVLLDLEQKKDASTPEDIYTRQQHLAYILPNEVIGQIRKALDVMSQYPGIISSRERKEIEAKIFSYDEYLELTDDTLNSVKNFKKYLKKNRPNANIR